MMNEVKPPKPDPSQNLGRELIVGEIVVGVVIFFAGCIVLGVPWIYLQILLADLIIIAGVLISALALHRLVYGEWPGLDKLGDWDGFIVSGVVLLYVIALAYVSFKGYSPGNWRTILRLAISVGALGGVIHEISQSGGKFAMPQWVGATNQSKDSNKNPSGKTTVAPASAAQPNAPAAQPNAPAAQPNAPAAQPNAPAAQTDSTNPSLYLGSLSGVLLGAVAGVLLMQTLTPPQNPMNFAIQVLVAGLALKGVSEALADTQAKQSTGQQTT